MADPKTSTQNVVKIDALRDNVVILKDRAMRALLRVSSINFALKSQDEQDAIIYEFQNFLNSLDFPVQIFVNSRFLNIEDYIEKLEEIERDQENELLRIQTQEYIKFIKDFVESATIVSTDFFVVVPLAIHEAQPEGAGGGGLAHLSALFGLGAAARPATMAPAQFAHYHGQLMQRVDFVAAGLHRMGLITKMMRTEEPISLFFKLYNPPEL